MTEYQPRRALREDEPALASADGKTTNAPDPAEPPSLPFPTPSAGPGGDYLSHRQILVVMSGLMAGMFLAALDQSIVAVASQDHLRIRRTGQAFLGRHRVPADLDGRHPPLGQDLRPPRPTADLPSRDRRLPDRLVDLRFLLPRSPTS